MRPGWPTGLLVIGVAVPAVVVGHIARSIGHTDAHIGHVGWACPNIHAMRICIPSQIGYIIVVAVCVRLRVRLCFVPALDELIVVLVRWCCGAGLMDILRYWLIAIVDVHFGLYALAFVHWLLQLAQFNQITVDLPTHIILITLIIVHIAELPPY